MEEKMKLRTKTWKLDSRGQIELAKYEGKLGRVLDTLRMASIYSNISDSNRSNNYQFLLADGKRTITLKIRPNGVYMSLRSTSRFVPSYISQLVQNLDGEYIAEEKVDPKSILATHTDLLGKYHDRRQPPKGITMDQLV